eukprot:1034674-Prymnesium_polylepis.1
MSLVNMFHTRDRKVTFKECSLPRCHLIIPMRLTALHWKHLRTLATISRLTRCRNMIPMQLALLLETSVPATAVLMMLHKLMVKIMMMTSCPHLKDTRKKFLI